jgi:hypothetical protein
VPNLDEARALLGNAVTINRPACVFHYATQNPPQAWEKNALLRFHRLVRVDGDGRSVTLEYPLSVSQEHGILLGKKNAGAG